jgi:hypothetical protein
MCNLFLEILDPSGVTAKELLGDFWFLTSYLASAELASFLSTFLVPTRSDTYLTPMILLSQLPRSENLKRENPTNLSGLIYLSAPSALTFDMPVATVLSLVRVVLIN